MPAERVFLTSSLEGALLLGSGQPLHVGKWRYTFRGGQARAQLQRYDVIPMIEHKFDDLEEMQADIEAECEGNWNRVSYFERKQEVVPDEQAG